MIYQHSIHKFLRAKIKKAVFIRNKRHEAYER